MPVKWRAFSSPAFWTGECSLVRVQAVSSAFCPNCICILIVYSTIRGRIDQVNQVLELDKQSVCAARYNALDKWTSQLATLHLAVVNKMA